MNKNFVRFTLVAALAGVLNACDLAGDNGGPGSSPGLLGQLPPGPLQGTPPLDNLLASLGGAEQQSNGFSYEPSVSDNGLYIAFYSEANNLVPGDTNGVYDIFLRDLTTGQTILVTQNTTGGPTDGYSFSPFISANGRYIAFESQATNLVVGDTNNQQDVFLYDRDPANDGGFDGVGGDLPTMTLVSRANGGSTQGNQQSSRGTVSDNGIVAFYSYATNLVAGDTNNTADVFVRAGTTTLRVSVEHPTNPDGLADGQNCNNESLYPCISANGQFVAFTSYATDIFPGDANNAYDIFRVNIGSLVMDRVSSTGGAAPAQANNWSYCALYGGGGRSISANGTKVAFSSYATNLVPGDTNGTYDVFVRDYSVSPATTTRLLGPGFQQANNSGFTFEGKISSDGTKVTFFSSSTNFDTNNNQDVFETNLASGVTIPVSIHSDGSQGNGYSELCSINGNGQFVVFTSNSSNLVDNDTNGQNDIFMRDTANGVTTRVSVPSSGVEANENSFNPYLASGAPIVVYQSDASNITANDVNGASDIFSMDRSTGIVKIVSLDSSGNAGNNGSFNPVSSSDGRFVAFDSFADNLVFPDFNGSTTDVFVRDMAAGLTTLVSHNDVNDPANGLSRRPSISSDGRFVAFESDASNLVDPNLDTVYDDDQNGRRDIFVHDRQPTSTNPNGTTTRVSVDSTGLEGNGDSFNPRISADGRFIVFESDSDNLVPGDTNTFRDIFVHDRVTGQTTRVSVATGGAEGTGSSFNGTISGNGRIVAFESDSTNLVAADGNGVYDVFVHDRQTGVTTRVSTATGGVEATGGDSFNPTISSDGRFVAFPSFATDLVPADLNGFCDIFRHDRTTGQTIRVSVDSAGNEADGNSFTVTLTGDGRWAAFGTTSANLVPGDTSNFEDIILRGPLP
jgi:hypothetical protein